MDEISSSLPVQAPLSMVMEDCTEAIIASGVPEIYETTETVDEDVLPWGWDLTEADITVDMLRRRHDIREALISGLIEAFPDTFEEDADIPDEIIIEMMNIDPEVKTHLIEILLELTDCHDAEGDTSYYPSISEFSSVEDIISINRLIGFRESREAIPYKYEHLTTESISLIYSNPKIFPIISKMKKENITDALIRSVLAK